MNSTGQAVQARQAGQAGQAGQARVIDNATLKKEHKPQLNAPEVYPPMRAHKSAALVFCEVPVKWTSYFTG